MPRVYNFSAGPGTLPEDVLLQAADEMLDWHGTGQSVMEMSHRGKEFISIAEQAEANLRKLLAIPDDYHVLFLQGGASLQFEMIPMNLIQGRAVSDYINTGEWAKKAINAAKSLADVNVAASAEDRAFTYVPAQSDWQLTERGAYVHYTANETINGVEFGWTPDVGDVPLISDMSSNLLSRPLDMQRFGLIYAGAQKNIGPAGLALVIVRDDLIGLGEPTPPAMLDPCQGAIDVQHAADVRGLRCGSGVPVAAGDRRAGRRGATQYRQVRAAVRLHRQLGLLRQPG
jgi:phosphoserine aminotransferase